MDNASRFTVTKLIISHMASFIFILRWLLRKIFKTYTVRNDNICLTQCIVNGVFLLSFRCLFCYFLLLLSWDKNKSYICCHFNELLANSSKKMLSNSLDVLLMSKFLNSFDKSLYEMKTHIPPP